MLMAVFAVMRRSAWGGRRPHRIRVTGRRQRMTTLRAGRPDDHSAATAPTRQRDQSLASTTTLRWVAVRSKSRLAGHRPQRARPGRTAMGNRTARHRVRPCLAAARGRGRYRHPGRGRLRRVPLRPGPSRGRARPSFPSWPSVRLRRPYVPCRRSADGTSPPGTRPARPSLPRRPPPLSTPSRVVNFRGPEYASLSMREYPAPPILRSGPKLPGQFRTDEERGS
jgi:hypothetical protein